MLEPFFFGPDQALFGIYHPPSGVDCQQALVLCPPFFDDYRRFYRANVELAHALSELGWHVLRFDFEGTGDSWGELDQIKTLTTWSSNIQSAIDELLEISGFESVKVVASRLSASLTQLHSLKHVSHYVLWDPVTNGANYLNIMRHNDALKKRKAIVRGFYKQKDGAFDNFAMHKDLQSSLSDMMIPQLTPTSIALVSRQLQSHTFVSSTCVPIDFDCQWDDFGQYYGELMTPKPILSKLLDIVCQS